MAIVVLTIGLVALCAVAIASVYAQYRQRGRLHESLDLMADAHNTFKKKFEEVLETFEGSTPLERRMAHKTEAVLGQASYYGNLTTQNVLTAIKRLGYEELGHGERVYRVYSMRPAMSRTYSCDLGRAAVKSDWAVRLWAPLLSGAHEFTGRSGELGALCASLADPKSDDWATAYELRRAV